MIKTRAHLAPLFILLAAFLSQSTPARAGGVTLITHGLNGTTTDWISSMATNLPKYSRFPGPDFTIYKVYFYLSNSVYYLAATNDAGSPPMGLNSGEIILKLDWSQLANGNSSNTYQIASMVVPALLSTNFIPGMSNHAIAELPLHLIGHSRGGSLVCEISRLLGTNGVWVDHLTTLDPHPLNNDGFSDFIYTDVDAPAKTYANVLFHDNYWQHLNIIAYGEAVAGAYVRQLTDLDGGYSGTTGSHSDVHLWYHGTLDSRTPTGDGSANITTNERTAWYVPYESQGATAGFEYSLIGGADRLSTDHPVSPSTGAISNGMNQMWDFGAGNTNNRTALTTNNGAWPSLIKFDRLDTNQVVQGQSTSVKFFYQWARPSTSNAILSVYLDGDYNPFNSNAKLLTQVTVPGSGATVNTNTLSVPFYATNASPGWHSLFATITANNHTRYLYSPELVQVVVNQQAPTVDIAKLSASQFQIGINGSANQVIILETSSNLVGWQGLATNTLSSPRWLYTNTPPAGTTVRFYRALLSN